MRKAFWRAEKIGPKPTLGPDHTRPWVARITGPSAQYDYERRFLRPKQDWTEATNKGTQGVFWVFTLAEGEYYEAYRKTSPTDSERLWLTVNAQGEVVEIDRKEVDQWILETACVYRISPAQ